MRRANGSYASILIAIVVGGFATSLPAQSDDVSLQATLHALRGELADAQSREDAFGIADIVRRSVEALGDRAGDPEVADVYRPVPDDARPLTAEEAERGFERLHDFALSKKWWRIDLDPRASEHLPREAAEIVSACAIGAGADAPNREELLALAIDAGDYLLWTQKQGGVGVYPFPRYRDGRNAAFQSAERFLRAAEREGRLDEIVREGWVVGDLSDGGLQFDNGRCGGALLDLYEVTRDERYLDSAVAAADWAAERPIVTNWNYNAFSVELLARVAAISGKRKYLDAAWKKADLGVLPGQLREGPRAGRWADPHNARPAYHYIMLRALVELIAASSADHPSRPAAIAGLRRGLLARNAEMADRGIMDSDSSTRCLVRVAELPPAMREELDGTRCEDALRALELYAAEELRKNRGPAGPVAIASTFARALKQDESK